MYKYANVLILSAMNNNNSGNNSDSAVPGLEAKIGSAQIMVIFPIIGAVAIGGFGIARFLNNELFLAGFDFLIALCFFSLSLYTYLTGKDQLARYASAVVSIIGPIILFYNYEDAGPYWVYTSAIVLFYLLPYPQAIVGNLGMLLGIGFVYYEGSASQLEMYSFLVTITLINLFSLLFALNEERHKKTLQEMSMRDDMTGIGNRRAFASKVDEALGQYDRHQRSVCLVYIDIDHFKQINDTFGHAMGDRAIVGLAGLIRNTVRNIDSVFRIGGDEFVIIAEAIDEATAVQFSEKIRDAVNGEAILPDYALTISMGVAMLQEGDTHDSWIARADQGLYGAKESGRNQVFAAK